MGGNGSKGYTIIENKKFKLDVEYLCREIGVSYDHIQTILNVVKLAIYRFPRNLPPIPDHNDKKFVFTKRSWISGIHVPSLRILIKIDEKEHIIELLALCSTDVRL